MKTEYEVLTTLQEIIATQLGDHVEGLEDLPSITIANVEIAFPDVDRMKRNTMFFIQPDYEHLEQLSIRSDLATMQVTLFILCKGASNATLIQRVFAYYTACYRLVKTNPTLDGFIDFIQITDMDYYPAVTAAKTMTAIEMSVELQWSKDI
jgi:hypothetical protein